MSSLASNNATTKATVRVGVGVFIMNKANTHFIMGIRGPATSIGQGEWSLPGGHLEVGESWEECSYREVQEETGIILKLDSIKYLTTVNNLFKTGQHYITIFMITKLNYDHPIILNPEVDKCFNWEWQSIDQMKSFPTSSLFLPLRNLLIQLPQFDPSLFVNP